METWLFSRGPRPGTGGGGGSCVEGTPAVCALAGGLAVRRVRLLMSLWLSLGWRCPPPPPLPHGPSPGGSCACSRQGGAQGGLRACAGRRAVAIVSRGR